MIKGLPLLRRQVPAAVTTVCALAAVSGAAEAQTAACPQGLRKINIGVSVAPPNVVHTTPYVAKTLGIFEKYCVDANIIQFDGGSSPAANAAVSQGTALVSVQAPIIAQGVKAKQVWGLAPRAPQAYVTAEGIKTVADLKGKRLSAAGGGVGSFNWRNGREVLKTAGLTVDDVQFISQGTAGRLPGLIAGQVDAVFLHPEDVYLAQKQKPGLNILVRLAEIMPNYMFNAYGAADSMVQKDRALVVDALAAMIEANRTIYKEKDKVIPIMVEATKKPKDAVEFAWDFETKNCVWSVNTGLSPERTNWTVQNDVDAGDIDPAKKPSFEQMADIKLAEEAVQRAGGPVTIGNCKD